MFSLLNWLITLALGASLISCGVANAQDAPVSKIAALLPSSREVSGLQSQIANAGFSAPQDLGITYLDSMTSGFYFPYKVTGVKEDAKPIAGSSSPVGFNGLFAPDGAPIRMRAGINQMIFFTGVHPQWDHVRAEFEVRNPLASDEDTGSITTHKEFDLVDLPAPGQTKTPDNPVEFTTPNGTRLQLIEITHTADSGSLRALWRVAPTTKQDVKVQLLGNGAFYRDGTEHRGVSSSTSPEGRDGDYIVHR